MPLPIPALPITMIEPSFRTSLVAAVGATPLMPPGFGAASEAAIALSAITVLTDIEYRVTCATAANPRMENHFAVNRHAPSLAGLDNGNGSWQVGTSFDAW